jgi:GntR family transcriptional regulator
VSGIAKYQKVIQQLEAMIQSGIYNDRKLPAEPELAEKLGVSRSVIRQAYGELERGGVIERRAGIGTTLKNPHHQKGTGITSLAGQITAADMQPSTQVLAAERLLASAAEPRVSAAFGLSPDVAAQTPLYRIDRLRCGDDHPVARQVIYLLAVQFRDDLLKTADFTRSIFAIYAEHDRFPAHAEEVISVRLATEAEIKLLKMKDLPASGRFVYVRDRITYDGSDRVLEVMRSVDRGDFFRSYRYAIQGAHLVDGIAERDPDAQGGGDV